MTADDPPDPAHVGFMNLALDEAEAAAAADEVPVGAVIVSLESGRVIAAAGNQRERRQDPTAHAEMVAIAQAAAVLGSWRLEKCALYVTLEPCPMCAGAVVLARLDRLVYGALDPKAGAVGSLMDIPRDSRLNHRCAVRPGVRADEASALLTTFSRARRTR